MIQTPKRSSMGEQPFKNRDLEIATTHLRTSKEELGQCAERLFGILQELEEQIDERLKDRIVDAIATLQMQDIITQRLDKVAAFLTKIDDEVILRSSSDFSESFAWENEVDQDDVDALFNQYKG